MLKIHGNCNLHFRKMHYMILMRVFINYDLKQGNENKMNHEPLGENDKTTLLLFMKVQM